MLVAADAFVVPGLYRPENCLPMLALNLADVVIFYEVHAATYHTAAQYQVPWYNIPVQYGMMSMAAVCA